MMDVHARSVVSSLSSRASGGVRQPLTGLSVSPDAKNAAAVGKDVLHVLRLDGFERGKVDRLDEIRSIRVSQVCSTVDLLKCTRFRVEITIIPCGLMTPL